MKITKIEEKIKKLEFKKTNKIRKLLKDDSKVLFRIKKHSNDGHYVITENVGSIIRSYEGYVIVNDNTSITKHVQIENIIRILNGK